MTVKLIRALIQSLQLHCQFDEYELVETDAGLLVKFPILGSDPEHYFELFNIQHEGNMNVINLDWIVKQLKADAPDMRACLGEEVLDCLSLSNR